jgi:hypothetical protein
VGFAPPVVDASTVVEVLDVPTAAGVVEADVLTLPWSAVAATEPSAA